MKKKNNLSAVFGNFYNWYLGILTILVSLPVIAPILLKLGLTSLAKMVYLLYSFFCHQFANRSIHLFDYQYAWCSRDTGIWFGVAAIAYLIKLKKIKPIKWYWVIPFVIPIALDGGLQTIFTVLNIQASGTITGTPLYVSNNLARFLTGAFFGIGLSLWVSGTLFQETEEQSSEAKSKKLTMPVGRQVAKDLIFSQTGKIIMVFIALTIGYFGLVGLWNITGVNSKPADFGDSITRTPITDFFERRADAVCGTKGVSDVFNLGCFFE